MSDANESIISQFLRELCDSSVVKRPVTLLARRYRTMIGRHGRKYYDINSLHLAGNNSNTLACPLVPQTLSDKVSLVSNKRLAMTGVATFQWGRPSTPFWGHFISLFFPFFYLNFPFPSLPCFSYPALSLSAGKWPSSIELRGLGIAVDFYGGVRGSLGRKSIIVYFEPRNLPIWAKNIVSLDDIVLRNLLIQWRNASQVWGQDRSLDGNCCPHPRTENN